MRMKEKKKKTYLYQPKFNTYNKICTGYQFLSVDIIHGHVVPLSIISSSVYEEKYHDAKTTFLKVESYVLISEFAQGLY